MIDVTFAACQRLIDEARASFKFIGNVADYEAVSGLPRSLPCAYVLPVSESAGQNAMLGSSLQQHSCTLAVIIIVRHSGDASGARAVGSLHELREAAQAALVNWTPQGLAGNVTCSPLAFAGGELLEFIDGTTLWRDEFTTDRFVARP